MDLQNRSVPYLLKNRSNRPLEMTNPCFYLSTSFTWNDRKSFDTEKRACFLLYWMHFLVLIAHIYTYHCQFLEHAWSCLLRWYFGGYDGAKRPKIKCQKLYFYYHRLFLKERTDVTIGFALPSTNRGLKRKENSSDFGVRTTRGKTNSQLAWEAGKELVTIPRYRICYNWKQYRTQAWTSTV